MKENNNLIPQRFILRPTAFNSLLIKYTHKIWESGVIRAEERAEYYRRLIETLLPESQEENSLLDIASRDCSLTLRFSQRFHKTCAIDVAFAPIVHQSKIKERIDLIQADAERLPFDDKSFDVVTAISIIEHVKNPQLMLKELIRVLKPGGNLVIQLPNRFFPVEPHCGLLFIYYVPAGLRKFILTCIGYEDYLNYVPGIPSRSEVLNYIGASANLFVSKTIVLPEDIIPAGLRPLYRLSVKLGLLNLIPESWLLVFKAN